MPRYRVLTEEDRDKMLSDLKRAPLEHNGRRGFNVTATRRTRTHEQNDLLWDLLTAFEEQCEMGGRKFNKEAWKVIFMNALGFWLEVGGSLIAFLFGRPIPLFIFEVRHAPPREPAALPRAPRSAASAARRARAAAPPTPAGLVRR